MSGSYDAHSKDCLQYAVFFSSLLLFNPKWCSISLFETGLQVDYQEAYEHVQVSQDMKEASLTSGGRNMQWKQKKKLLL